MMPSNPAIWGPLTVAGAFVIGGTIFTVWEFLQPRQKLSRRSQLLRDTIALGTVVVLLGLVEFMLAPLRTFLQELSIWRLEHCRELLNPACILRLAAFYLLWDFSLYVAHWLMHRDFLWSTHKWHHAPTKMWWLAGVRASFIHILLFQMAFLWFWVCGLPFWLAAVTSAESILRCGWMHLNVRGNWLRYLEYVVVTPRYHAIHHCDVPELYRKNLGSLSRYD